MAFNDTKYMKRALELAAKARGRTSPNPMVGAVIVKNGEIIGEGFHLKAGTSHAEVHALNAAGDQAREATLYVSLEPCSHQGKTPPCTDAIIKSGIKKVVAACLDPNPRVSGRGLSILREAGVETIVGLLSNEAQKLNEAFFKYMQTGRPLVALKTAMTLDGKIATREGDSKWITGEDARQYVHHLRNNYDAIMVGIGTVLADDPLLNTRLNIKERRDPIRLVIDGNLDIPLYSKIVQSSREQKTVVFTAVKEEKTAKARQLEQQGVQVIEVAGEPGEIQMERVLEKLGQMEICSVLLEGGGTLNAYMLEKELVDKIYWFIAPKIFGGDTAISPVGGKGCARADEAREIEIEDIISLSRDILIIGYMRKKSG